MIIERLTLHNFGVYAGTNTLVFDNSKPVILIGGLNGRGKTTLLEAVLLGLYGDNSFSYKESPYKSYGQYLKAHTNMRDSTGIAWIELVFSMDKSFSERYSVKREWNASGLKVSEKIHVLKNQEKNSFLSENWPLFIESILPSALSSFFFFDGEKIVELAADNTNAQIKEAIKSLLGINIIDVLKRDLEKISYSAIKTEQSKNDSYELDSRKKRLDECREALNSIDDRIAMTSSRIESAKETLERMKNDYSIHGGDIVAQKQDLMAKRISLQGSVSKLQEELVEMVSGDLPLYLVRRLLKSIEEKGLEEQKQRIDHIVSEKMRLKYKEYTVDRAEDRSLKEFIEYIESDLKDADPEINISDDGLFRLKRLLDAELSDSVTKTTSIMKERNRYRKQLDDVESYLSVEIDEKRIGKLYKIIIAKEREIAELEVELDDYAKERVGLNGAYINADTEYRHSVEAALRGIEDSETEGRVIKYSEIAKTILEAFSIELQENKTGLLGNTMTRCYKLLANKHSLIQRIEVDPKTLAFHYIDYKGEELNKEVLSAGEKQLMVISLLWSLSKCSKRKLPVIIDTPLARLDSKHRKTIVEHYFPSASDQTILLSTDTEISGELYLALKDNIGSEYTLDYDDDTRCSCISSGYFKRAE